MKKKYYVSLIILFVVSSFLQAGLRVTLFFQQEPVVNVAKISQKLKQPGKMAKYIVKGTLQASPIQGFVGVYGGFVAASDYNGELSFPRKHISSSVDILITPEIVPIPLFESTIARLRRVTNAPAKMYRCQLEHDRDKGSSYWRTSEVVLSDDDLAIPPSAIVIFQDPSNIRMNVGDTPAIESGNLVLPIIYIKKGTDSVKNISHLLTIRHLFKPVDTEEHRESLKTLTQIVD